MGWGGKGRSEGVEREKTSLFASFYKRTNNGKTETNEKVVQGRRTRDDTTETTTLYLRRK